MNKDEFFKELDRIRNELNLTVKLFENAGGRSATQSLPTFVDQFKELSCEFEKAIKDYLGPGIWA